MEVRELMLIGLGYALDPDPVLEKAHPESPWVYVFISSKSNIFWKKSI
jgi:hypothetical protein